LPAGPAGNAQVFGQPASAVLAKGKTRPAGRRFPRLLLRQGQLGQARASTSRPPAASLSTPPTWPKVNPLFTPEQLHRWWSTGSRNGTVLARTPNSAKLQTLVQSALDPLWKAGRERRLRARRVCKAIDPVLGQ